MTLIGRMKNDVMGRMTAGRNGSISASFRLPIASWFLLLFFATVLTSCLSYKEVELEDVTNIEVLQMDLKGIVLRVDARINNPNGYKIQVLDPDVDLFINGTFIGKGLLDTALVLDRKSTKLYSIPMHAELNAGSLLSLMLSGTLNDKKVTLAAKGTVVGKALWLRKRFPFELEEEMEL